MTRVPLHGRGGVVRDYALVDADMAEAVLARRWFLNHHGYAWCWGPGKEFMSMHRIVVGLARGDAAHVDHRNHDKLDNRRANLRACTRSLNQQNRSGAASGSSSRFRGVCWDKRGGRWKAYATLGRRQHNLGYFDDEREAARVASAFRAEHMPFSNEVGMGETQ